jgi:hypothetical protein
MQARIDYVFTNNLPPADINKQINCYLYDPNLNILLTDVEWERWTINPFDMPIYQDLVTRFSTNIVGKKVLIVGSGIGILNQLVKNANCAELWIIEPNQNQLARLENQGFVNGGTTHIIENRWEDALFEEGFPTNFDFIYYNVGFDAFADDYNGVLGFSNFVKNYLNTNGIYAWWIDRHSTAVNRIVINNEIEYCTVKLILEDHGFTVQNQVIEIAPQVVPASYDICPLINNQKYESGFKWRHEWVQKIVNS